MGYRYRLSLKVARDGCIFGLTVFGACLNTFFGIDASGLQRLAPQTVLKDASFQPLKCGMNRIFCLVLICMQHSTNIYHLYDDRRFTFRADKINILLLLSFDNLNGAKILILPNLTPNFLFSFGCILKVGE